MNAIGDYRKYINNMLFKPGKKKLAASLIFLLCLLSGPLVYINRVDNTLTPDDFIFIDKFMGKAGHETTTGFNTYDQELEFIIAAQQAVLGIAGRNQGIPFYSSREPRDVYLAGHGLCHDRSRVIEKILRAYNFQTRHVAIYSTWKTGSGFISLITPGTRSHAVTEVLTKRGWLVVDSNRPWISSDKDNMPVSIKSIRLNIDTPFITWPEKNIRFMDKLMTRPFVYVYGLYSRHGKFYPPYNIIPDINYSEFFQNIIN